MERKRYKINETFGIDCIKSDKGMSIEVFLIQVPWEEVVDAVYNINDSSIANSEFKRLVAKYKPLSFNFI